MKYLLGAWHPIDTRFSILKQYFLFHHHSPVNQFVKRCRNAFSQLCVPFYIPTRPACCSTTVLPCTRTMCEVSSKVARGTHPDMGQKPHNLQPAQGSAGISGGPARKQVGSLRLHNVAKRVKTVPATWRRHDAVNEIGVL